VRLSCPMILSITNAYIKDTSWKSFFATEKIALAITETNSRGENSTRTFSLKCRNCMLNYFHFFDEDNKLTLSMLKNGRLVHRMSVVDTSDRFSYADGGLKVLIELQLLNCDIFTYLENRERKRNGQPEIAQISKVIEVYSATEHRMSHDDRVYRVDKTNCCMSWQNTTIDQVSSCRGWEQIRTRKQLILWVNHGYQLVYLPGRTPVIVESEIERKTHAFYNALQRFETFKYLIFTKFALFTIRGFFVQSTASYFLRSEENMLRRNLHIKIKDEIGEDEGGIKNEFFNEVGLEIASDRRMLFTGSFLDVNRNVYDDGALSAGHGELSANGRENESTSERGGNSKTVERAFPYDRSALEVDVNAMKSLKEQMMRRLSFSKQPLIDTTATLRFWQSPEARNKKFIEDTDPAFYAEPNINTNLLSNDEFYAYLGTFLALCFLNREMISVKFSLAFWENLMGRKYTLRHVQDTQVQRNLLYVLREDLSEDFLDTFDDDLIRTDKQAICKENRVRIAVLLKEARV
ncbi:putative HECT protein, partial [Trachipleistophora hominis]